MRSCTFWVRGSVDTPVTTVCTQHTNPTLEENTLGLLDPPGVTATEAVTRPYYPLHARTYTHARAHTQTHPQAHSLHG